MTDHESLDRVIAAWDPATAEQYDSPEDGARSDIMAGDLLELSVDTMDGITSFNAVVEAVRESGKIELYTKSSPGPFGAPKNGDWYIHANHMTAYREEEPHEPYGITQLRHLRLGRSDAWSPDALDVSTPSPPEIEFTLAPREIEAMLTMARSETLSRGDEGYVAQVRATNFMDGEAEVPSERLEVEVDPVRSDAVIAGGHTLHHDLPRWNLRILVSAEEVQKGQRTLLTDGGSDQPSVKALEDLGYDDIPHVTGNRGTVQELWPDFECRLCTNGRLVSYEEPAGYDVDERRWCCDYCGGMIHEGDVREFRPEPWKQPIIRVLNAVTGAGRVIRHRFYDYFDGDVEAFMAADEDEFRQIQHIASTRAAAVVDARASRYGDREPQLATDGGRDRATEADLDDLQERVRDLEEKLDRRSDELDDELEQHIRDELVDINEEIQDLRREFR